MPAQNDPHIPGAVRKAEGACRNKAARIREAYAARAVALEQRIAADEATVEPLGQKHLPGPERLLPGWVHFGVLVLRRDDRPSSDTQSPRRNGRKHPAVLNVPRRGTRRFAREVPSGLSRVHVDLTLDLTRAPLCLTSERPSVLAM